MFAYSTNCSVFTSVTSRKESGASGHNPNDYLSMHIRRNEAVYGVYSGKYSGFPRVNR